MEQPKPVLCLPTTCSLLVNIKKGGNYVIHICPILQSIVLSLDLDQLRQTATDAYQQATHQVAPKHFAILIECTSKEKMEFVLTRTLPYNWKEPSLLATFVPQLVTMKDFFAARAPVKVIV
jgi:hypothetical protein